MKRFVLLLISTFIIFFSCNAPKLITKDINMSEIINAPGIPKNDLYVDINSWMAEFFADRESVVEFQDKDAGKVIGKFKHQFGESEYKSFVIDVDIRDESFRMTLKGSVDSYIRDENTPKYFDPERNVYYRTHPDEYPLTEKLFDFVISNVVEYLNNDNDW